MIFKKWKKLTFTLVIAMLLSITGCKGGSSSDNPPAPSATPTPTPEIEISEQVDCTMIRQAMIDTTDMAAIAYLGTYFDYYAYSDFAEIQDFVADSGILDNHPFVADIDEEHFVPHIGGQIFCIVPLDEEAIITVYDYVIDYETLEESFGEVLYQSIDGSPILIMGNESEIIPNLFIEIVDSDGNMLEYIPYISGMDGMLELPYEAPTMCDFSNYDKLLYFIPEFDPSILSSMADWTTYVYTINNDQIAGGFYFNEDSTMEFCYETEEGNGFEIYYEGIWYPAEDDIYPENTYVFELWLTEDHTETKIARPEIITTMSFEMDYTSGGVCMCYQAGDYLFDIEEEMFYVLVNAAG